MSLISMWIELPNLIDLLILPILKQLNFYLNLVDCIVLPPLNETVPEEHRGLHVELTGPQETQDVNVVVFRC
jgi:hypothetical protein